MVPEAEKGIVKVLVYYRDGEGRLTIRLIICQPNLGNYWNVCTHNSGPVRRPRSRSRGLPSSRPPFPSRQPPGGLEPSGHEVSFILTLVRLLLKRCRRRARGAPTAVGGGLCVSDGHPQRGRVCSEASARPGHTGAGVRVGVCCPAPRARGLGLRGAFLKGAPEGQ